MERKNEGTIIIGHPDPIRQAEEEWIDEEAGDIIVKIGKLEKELFGFQDYVAAVKLDKADMYCQVLLGPEYSELEAHEIAAMVGRVLKSHFVRTRLLPLVGDIGEPH